MILNRKNLQVIVLKNHKKCNNWDAIHWEPLSSPGTQRDIFFLKFIITYLTVKLLIILF